MATNSLIVRANRDGSFDAIKVHFGHPDSLGPKLLLHFNDDAKIAELLALGQLSTLEAEIGEKHRFNDPHPGWCIAYERDRGDDPVPARHHENLEDLVQSARKQFVAHVFVWTINPETEQRGWAE